MPTLSANWVAIDEQYIQPITQIYSELSQTYSKLQVVPTYHDTNSVDLSKNTNTSFFGDPAQLLPLYGSCRETSSIGGGVPQIDHSYSTIPSTEGCRTGRIDRFYLFLQTPVILPGSMDNFSRDCSRVYCTNWNQSECHINEIFTQWKGATRYQQTLHKLVCSTGVEECTLWISVQTYLPQLAYHARRGNWRTTWVLHNIWKRLWQPKKNCCLIGGKNLKISIVWYLGILWYSISKGDVLKEVMDRKHTVAICTSTIKHQVM